MIVGYHVIFGMYGFWLPNDPRGSWSGFVGSWDLCRYGPATKTHERRSLAHRSHDRAARLAAKEALKYPPVVLDDGQITAVAQGFAHYFARSDVPVWACAIMPDHVHLVTGRPRYDIEKLAIQVKGDASEALVAAGMHPLASYRDARGKLPKCFARGQWKVFLDPDDVPRAVRYVEANPIREGMPPQRWPFVTPHSWDGG